MNRPTKLIAVASTVGCDTTRGVRPEIAAIMASPLNVSVGTISTATIARVRSTNAAIRRQVLPRIVRQADRKPNELPQAAAGNTSDARVNQRKDTTTPTMLAAKV